MSNGKSKQSTSKKPDPKKTSGSKNTSKSKANKSDVPHKAPEVSKPEPRESETTMTETAAPETTASDTVTSPEISESSTKAGRPRRPMGPVTERLVDKIESVVKDVTLLLKLSTNRGAPDDTKGAIQNLLAEADMVRGNLKALQESGWVPSEKKASLPAISIGDVVTITAEQKGRYAYIPGVSDGTVQLTIGNVTTVGKATQVLLKSADGKDSYGWASRSHVELVGEDDGEE